MKKKIIIGNLKMNLISPMERDKYLENLGKEFSGKRFDKSEVVFCPPFIHMEKFKAKLNNAKVGAQDTFWERSGSYTGEISSAMLKNIGCEFVIIGHSERRKYFEETDEIVNSKCRSVLKEDLNPIICVGESAEEREAGKIKDIITSQVEGALNEVDISNAEKIVIAYEPIWSVGTDSVPISDEILEVKILIKKILSKKYGSDLTEKIRVIYGGSVKASTAKELCIDPEMDGALVGRESLNPKEFLELAEIINNG